MNPTHSKKIRQGALWPTNAISSSATRHFGSISALMDEKNKIMEISDEQLKRTFDEVERRKGIESLNLSVSR